MSIAQSINHTCYDHTTQNRPPLIRTANLTCVGLHQYWVEGSPGNTECRSAFCSIALLQVQVLTHPPWQVPLLVTTQKGPGPRAGKRI